MFKLEFSTTNAAFCDGNNTTEIERILQKVAKQVANGVTEGKIRDINGNTIGLFTYTESE